jgi:sRNA-binding protein
MLIDKSAIGPQGRPLIRLKATSGVVEPKSAPTHPGAVSAPAKGALKLNERQLAIRDAENWLRSRWPAAFESHHPLAIGIGDVIVGAAEIEGRALLPVKRAIRRWVSRKDYLNAIIAEGSVRIGLDGGVVEPVSDAAREHARQRLEARQANRLAKRQRRREARAAEAKVRGELSKQSEPPLFMF